MTTKNVTLQEAEGHLAELLELVAQGNEIVITKGDEPRAKLVMVQERPRGPRVFGQHRGQAWLSDDFDAPLPPDFWAGEGSASK